MNGRLAITNDHVVAGDDDRLFAGLNVTLSDGTKLPASVVFRSPAEDLAGIIIPDLGDQAPHLAIAASTDGLRAGQRAYMGGFPSLASRNDALELGLHGTPYELSRANRYAPILSEGSFIGREVRTEWRNRGQAGATSVAEIDHTGHNWKGFSGAGYGVLNDAGRFEVVGVNSRMMTEREPSRAIAADYLNAFLAHIAENGGLPESGYVKFFPDIRDWKEERPAHLDLRIKSMVIR
jgi:hypothetical protein